MAIHPDGCTCSLYGCQLRLKGIQVSAAATPTKTRNTKRTYSVPPAINAKVICEDRPGGYKMPLLNPDMSVVRHVQYRDNEKSIEATRRRVRNSGTTS